MLDAFAETDRVPTARRLFVQQDDLFLVEERVPGVTLRRWAASHVAVSEDAGWGPVLAEVERIATGLVDLMELVHARGFVLRDFNPNNVMVDDELDLRLIDLEMLARPGELVTRGHTPGYAAPEQMAGPSVVPAPDFTADLYSLGATLFYLATGIHPALPADGPAPRPFQQRISEWLDRLAAGNIAARTFAPIIVALMHEEPARRPGLAEVRSALAEAAGDASLTAGTADRPPGPDNAELTRRIIDGVGHLVATMEPANSAFLWPPSTFGGKADPCNVQYGAAGVLALLARAYRASPEPPLRDAVASATGWIRRRITGESRLLPGLYFGRSGTAWALLDAGLLLGDEHVVRLASDLARRVPVRWPNPDVCHGVAGAGLTQLRFWEATGEDGFLQRTREAADAVVHAAEHRDDGVRWPIPGIFDSNLAGLSHYGFAHGVAGCAAFLLAAGRALGDDPLIELAARGADSLVKVAQHSDGAAYWSSGDSDQARKTNWCSGSSGIGTFLVQMWRTNGDQRLLDLARQAAVAVYRSRWHAGPCQCHGLAGDGEFLLDLADASGEACYRDWATDLAASIYLRNARWDGRIVAPDQTSTSVVADFNVGLAGVLAFLLRLRDGGPRMWLPETFTGPYDR